jgi:UDP-N-acetylmuramoyl-tripeptide--D-alanyl-D-alanine ligase
MRLMGDFLTSVLKGSRFWVGPVGLKAGMAGEEFKILSCPCELCQKTMVALQSDSGLACSMSTDSRNIEQGQIYCAISGKRVDGHRFVVEALEKGASGLMVEEKMSLVLDAIPENNLHGVLCIVVKDSTSSIVRLASSWRQAFACPVIGITGSVGKTTTKEITRLILKKANLKAFVSPGNFNTILGVALSILRMEPGLACAVFEVGINDAGEMLEISNLLRPTMGLVTCVAHSHTQGLGSMKGVAAEKAKLFSGFGPRNIGIINGDSKDLVEVGYSHPVAKFGLKTVNQVQARKVDCQRENNGDLVTKFVMKIYGRKHNVVLNGWHQGLVANSLGAATVAALLEIPDECILQGLQAFKGVEGRYEQFVSSDGNSLIISDCYNASPESMRAALLAFSKIESRKKIAVLGDMLELGEKEEFWHRQVGRMIKKVRGIDYLILVGKRAESIAKTVHVELPIKAVEKWQDAKKYLNELMQERSAVLFKSSRAVGLSNLAKEFRKPANAGG